jgi:DNA-binding NarL/FixJ family response regulator
VLIDMEMPGMSGMETSRRIREVAPDVRLIAVSAHDEDLVKARAVEAGAEGYLSKLAPLSEVAGAVRAVNRGEPLLDRFELRRLQRRLKHQRHQDSTERQRANRLTPRQQEILQLMADGVTAAEIVQRLEVSPATLRTHVQNIIMKLGVHSKTEALALAIRHGKVSVRV